MWRDLQEGSRHRPTERSDNRDVALMWRFLPILPNHNERTEQQEDCADSLHRPDPMAISMVARFWMFTADTAIAHMGDPQRLLTAKTVVELAGLRLSSSVEDSPMNCAVARARGT